MAAGPEAVLARLHATEDAFARRRRARWGPRTLDLDLIAMGDTVLPDAATQARWRALDAAAQRSLAPDRLILPHPRMQERAFVLVPLADVAPGWRHPRWVYSGRDGGRAAGGGARRGRAAAESPLVNSRPSA